MTIDLASTRHCDVAPTCAACGRPPAAENRLGVQTATTPVGVICMTLCGWCTDDGAIPRHVGMAEAVEMAFAHCGHLGITIGEMDALQTPTSYTIRHYGGP